MEINGVSNDLFRDQAAEPPAAREALGKDDFLHLLVTQMKNQDPLDPMESAEFSAQLAQFSSLEQLTNLNDGVERLIVQEADTQNTQAVNFIGKQVTAYGNAIEVEEGIAENISFDLEGNAVDGFIYIYDEAGHTVTKIQTGPLDHGKNAIQWNGTDSEGEPVEDGTYTYEIVAVDGEGGPVPATPYTTAIVTGFSLGAESTVLMAGEGRAIAMENVIRVAQVEEALEEETGAETETSPVEAGEEGLIDKLIKALKEESAAPPAAEPDDATVSLSQTVSVPDGGVE